eukprot:TRINITY_DN4934_c0_g2_i1.p1 TRINITY_DN4934_c0_g2~~TRINITY_DN4934_c0_g2_i1.p1  ORF type:complete len:368 (+),score=58.48 TRINITY_DN4934_c0_g2_i1:12-1115(+)
MGLAPSKLEKELGTQFPEHERYFGLENFGNTCYCNSVLQALYHCAPFRQHILDSFDEPNPKSLPTEDNMMIVLADLFHNLSTQKKRTGVISPQKFITRLRKENDLFRSLMHQDAHEFLIYLLNVVSEILQSKLKILEENPGQGPAEDPIKPKRYSNTSGGTLVHHIFEGILINETKCLCCETITSKDESFLDLSIDVEQDASISHCLKNFSSTETLSRADKFYCDHCCSLQEAQKRMRIKKLPNILIVHLKRFKFLENTQRYTKLSYRVNFPLELKLCNTTSESEDSDRVYDLFAVVVHVGSGPNHGHYVSYIKSYNNWLVFDDDNVEMMEETSIQSCFGSTQERTQTSHCGYLLFYQSRSLQTLAS